MPEHIVDANPSVDALDAPPSPEDACVDWERCGNSVPGNAMMCADCLDRVRHNEGS